MSDQGSQPRTPEESRGDGPPPQMPPPAEAYGDPTAPPQPPESAPPPAPPPAAPSAPAPSAPPVPPPPPEHPYGAAPAPASGQAPDGGPVTRPKSMDLAVALMRVGAVLSLLSILSLFLTGDSIRSTVEQSLRDQGQSVDQSTLDVAVAVSTGTVVVFALVGAALWLWMASANGKGKPWARVVASVFFGLSVLGFLINLVQPQGALNRVLAVLGFLVGALTVFLLWRRESSRFYVASSAPRY